MDKCPFCGAELSRGEGEYKLYKCFTDTYGPRTEECYEHQIANLMERLEAWRNYRDCYILNRLEGYDLAYHKDIAKLKELGEI